VDHKINKIGCIDKNKSIKKENKNTYKKEAQLLITID